MKLAGGDHMSPSEARTLAKLYWDDAERLTPMSKKPKLILLLAFCVPLKIIRPQIISFLNGITGEEQSVVSHISEIPEDDPLRKTDGNMTHYAKAKIATGTIVVALPFDISQEKIVSTPEESKFISDMRAWYNKKEEEKKDKFIPIKDMCFESRMVLSKSFCEHLFRKSTKEYKKTTNVKDPSNLIPPSSYIPAGSIICIQCDSKASALLIVENIVSNVPHLIYQFYDCVHASVIEAPKKKQRKRKGAEAEAVADEKTPKKSKANAEKAPSAPKKSRKRHTSEEPKEKKERKRAKAK